MKELCAAVPIAPRAVHLQNNIFQMKQNHFFFCLLLLLAACNNKPKPDGQTSPASPVAPTDLRPVVYLEGCYATSSRPGNDISALFDDSSNNYWETRPGAGPDEGIMLYFQNAVPLSALQVEGVEGSFDPAKAAMQVYVNGKSNDPALPGSKVSLGNQPVKSLYLRFNTTGKENAFDVVENDMKTVIRTFPANASIRVRSIKLWNDKNEEVRLVGPLQQKGGISASTTLQPESAFNAANLFDGRKEFAWVEGNNATSGENEMLRFEFDSEVRLTTIQVWNGYQRSDEHFSANARVRDFSFGPVGGPAHTYTLRDTKAGQKIELSTAAQGKAFELNVKSIYPGKRYKDLAISEILFFDGTTPLALKTDFTERTSNAIKTASAASPLQAILDRRISNQTADFETTNKSIILRSDGTFVMYEVVEDSGDQILADGNWKLDKSDARSTTITVFGKWFSQYNLAAYYEGNTREEATRIFKDEVVITAEAITGTKMIGAFRVK